MCSLSQLKLPSEENPPAYEKICMDAVSELPEFFDQPELHYASKSSTLLGILRCSVLFNKFSFIKQRLHRAKSKSLLQDERIKHSGKYSFSSHDSFSRLSERNSKSSCSTLDLEEEKKILQRLFYTRKDLSPRRSPPTLCFSTYNNGAVRHARSPLHQDSYDVLYSYTKTHSENSELEYSAADDEMTQNTAILSNRKRLSLSRSSPVVSEISETERGTCHISEGLRHYEQRKHLVYDSQYQPMPTPLQQTSYGQRISITGLPSAIPQYDFENKLHKILTSSTPIDNSWLKNIGIGYTCRKGLKPESPNQDDFFIFLMEDWALYGVFDGHGPYGHDISNFVQKRLPCLIYENACFESNPKQALRFSFIMVQKLLEVESGCRNKFNCTLSGCTATVVLHRKIENKLYIAHVGDSRCVLGRYTNNEIVAVDLTTDHKPDNEIEKKRILEAGGQIRKLEGDIPYRVFLNGKRFPGLAISRALGDTAGVQAGITCEPDVREYPINSQTDIFILLCSDGVWEFLNSKFVVELVYCNGMKSAQLSADMIARESWERWIDEGNVVDDITVEVIYF